MTSPRDAGPYRFSDRQRVRLTRPHVRCLDQRCVAGGDYICDYVYKCLVTRCARSGEMSPDPETWELSSKEAKDKRVLVKVEKVSLIRAKITGQKYLQFLLLKTVSRKSLA